MQRAASRVRPGCRVAGTFLLLALSLNVALACTRQGEGERCISGNNESDCEGSLVCVQADELQIRETDRCCPPEGESISDERCLRRGSSPGTTSGGGPAPDAGSEGGAGGASGGEGGSVNGAGGSTGEGGSPPSGASGSAGESQGGAGGA